MSPDNEKKIIGTWTVEKIKNNRENSNLYEGALISFTENSKFRAPRVKITDPRTGRWEIIKVKGIDHLKIDSANPSIEGIYSVNEFYKELKLPNTIILVSVNSKDVSFTLSRLSTDPAEYLN
ncbi:hypothetical protein QQ020_30785 [Fulvivirgaceae bacterium BMA12]|uniref:Lipocalin-like domain-containing protein n=1 Tax=Agaribacillus aureus TaxID=3051825 RepID=A0ABT8LFE8_9BACT|nr:hypothetical protein [Fulvivirgaceae bacterium BMA12]